MSRRSILAPAAVALAALATVAWTGGAAAARSRPEPAPRQQQQQQQAGQQERQDDGVSLDGLGHDHGVAVARNWIAEFLDLGCGYCAKFAVESFPSIEREYLETGQVRWKSIPFVTGLFPNSEDAAVAAECAGEQGKYFEMHDSLLAARKEWTRPTGAPAVFNRVAKRLRLDQAAFTRCAAGPAARERIKRNTAVAKRLQIRGTPTFFINGQKVEGAIPLPMFRQVLEKLRG